METFICLLPVAGAPYEMLTNKPCWFRWQSLRMTAWPHPNQLLFWLKPYHICYKMATIGFLFNPILSAECEGSVTQSQTASNSLSAPEDTQTSFNCIYWVIHWLIWSYHKVRLYTYLCLRFLSSSHIEIEWKWKVRAYFLSFQFFNLQIIRTWPQIDMG